MRPRSAFTEGRARLVRTDEIVREVLFAHDRIYENGRPTPRGFGPDRSVLVFERDGVGRLVLREIPLPLLTREPACERCGRGVQEIPERLCLACAKEVFDE